MKAQFKSPCAACRAAIRRGDDIVMRDGKAIHAGHIKKLVVDTKQLNLFKR